MKEKFITKNYYLKESLNDPKLAPLKLALVTDVHEQNPDTFCKLFHMPNQI